MVSNTFCEVLGTMETLFPASHPKNIKVIMQSHIYVTCALDAAHSSKPNIENNEVRIKYGCSTLYRLLEK